MTTGSVSPRRADTRRNHERILVAAADALATTGQVSFNAIARAAGVGVGTVYRHFPTPEALVLAVYEREVRQLVDVVPSLLERYSPEQAFEVWATDHLAHYMMTKRGLADAMRAATTSGLEPPANAYQSVVRAVTTLLDANIEAGAIRAGVNPETVLRAMSGMLLTAPAEDPRTRAAELTDLLWRGLRADNATDTRESD